MYISRIEVDLGIVYIISKCKVYYFSSNNENRNSQENILDVGFFQLLREIWLISMIKIIYTILYNAGILKLISISVDEVASMFS
jgi:hypothetical protein